MTRHSIQAAKILLFLVAFLLPLVGKATFEESRGQVTLGRALTGEKSHSIIAYDYRTRRVLRSEQLAGASVPTLTGVVFSDGLAVEEFENGSTIAEFLRGPDMGGGVGGLLYSLRGNTPSYTHANHRGDIIAKTNAGGTTTWSANYDGFGGILGEFGSTLDRQKHSTKEEDPTGLVNVHHRYLDPEAGIWLTRDPIGFRGGTTNLYEYCGQNPWSRFDPNGLHWIDKFGKLVKVGEEAYIVLKNGLEVPLKAYQFANKAVELGDLVKFRKLGESELARIERLREKYGDIKIQYDEFAQPQFSEFALHDELRIDGLTGIQEKDAALAWQKLRETYPDQYKEAIRFINESSASGKKNLLNWHHAGDGRMELIDADLNLAFPHTGESALLRGENVTLTGTMSVVGGVVWSGISSALMPRTADDKNNNGPVSNLVFDGAELFDPSMGLATDTAEVLYRFQGKAVIMLDNASDPNARFHPSPTAPPASQAIGNYLDTLKDLRQLELQ